MTGNIKHSLLSRVIFVHSKIDDAGLTANEFRVYCHLARRAGSGLAFPSVETIAEVCRINRKTAWTVLSALEDYNMVARTVRPGRSNLYTLTDPSEWKPRLNWVDPIEGVTQSEYHPGDPKEVPPVDPIEVPRRLSHEGYPMKALQENTPLPPQAKTAKQAFDRHQFDDLIPDSLKVPEFLAAWADWVYDRKERRKPLTRLGAERQLKAMAKAGQATAIEAMQQSIINGWQGLYLDRSRTKQPRAPQQMPDWVYKKIQELKESIRRAEIEMRNYGPRQAYSIQECSKRIETMQAEIKRLEGGS